MHGVCLVVKLLYIQVFCQSQSDAGLATVMGHEVSMANHGRNV
jgi:hypothetical protein